MKLALDQVRVMATATVTWPEKPVSRWAQYCHGATVTFGRLAAWLRRSF